MKTVVTFLTALLMGVLFGLCINLLTTPAEPAVNVHVPGLQGPIPCKSGHYTQEWGRLRTDLYRIGGLTTCYTQDNQIAWAWHHPTKW